MAENSAIQWTDATWNPTTGCTKVSPGCAKCYIERTPPFRMAGRKFVKGHIPLQLHHDRLDTPLHWKKPRRVFVNSLSDLFHEDVPGHFICQAFAVMAACPQHTFQVLTKRPEWMRGLLADDDARRAVSEALLDMQEGQPGPVFRAIGEAERRIAAGSWPLPNVWLGTSVEDAKRKGRIDVLREVPAAVRFLSLEPLLEDLGTLDLTGIQWVIVGGESGPGARSCNLAWVRSIVAQCKVAGVACFVKQLGAEPFRKVPPYDLSIDEPLKLRDKKGGDWSEWPEDLRVREFPGGAA